MIVSKKLRITEKDGFHLRPAHRFVTAMEAYQAEIRLEFQGKTVNGKSILSLMAAGIPQGGAVTVTCCGIDEDAMLEKAALLLQREVLP